MSDLFKKLIVILILIIFSLFYISFLKNIQNIDSFAYVVAIGLDKGTSNNLKITFQTLSPATSSSSAKSSGGESSDQKSSSVITTSIECSSINSGIQLLNGYIGSKLLNLSHCQTIIFSEELAYDGISDYIYDLVNNVQVRHDTNIVVSKSNAEYYLNNSESVYEKLISKYYNISPTFGKYTGYTHDISLSTFFSDLNDSFLEPTAILSSINSPQFVQSNNYDDNYLRDSTYKAGQSPIESQNSGIEDVGLAVFKNGKLIGELTAIETIAYLLTTNNFEECELTILNPFDENSTIDFSLSKQKGTKNKIEFVNGTPLITTSLHLNANILSIKKGDNYSDSTVLSELESKLNSYIENIVYEYLYKTTMEYNSDISGFGKYAISKFLTTKDWNNYNWLENYKNSFFKVNVSTTIKSSNLILDT